VTISIPVSTVPQALLYLFNAVTEQIATDLYKNNVDIWLGDPGKSNRPDQIQINASVERTPIPFAVVGTGGPMSTYEKYGIVWKVSCFGRGDSAADISPVVMQRAYQLVAYIEAAVRLDMSFGDLLVVARPGQTQGGSPKWNNDRSGMLCDLTGRVQCEAEI
jgi:hypothetical protein